MKKRNEIAKKLHELVDAVLRNLLLRLLWGNKTIWKDGSSCPLKSHKLKYTQSNLVVSCWKWQNVCRASLIVQNLIFAQSSGWITPACITCTSPKDVTGSLVCVISTMQLISWSQDLAWVYLLWWYLNHIRNLLLPLDLLQVKHSRGSNHNN